jgi:glycosyltransferase involved in cell wall biosynthesis
MRGTTMENRMTPGVSVVICCHNGAKRLPETLRHLVAQKVPSGISWEVVIIDNASTDETVETARRCWPTSVVASLRIVSEPAQGIANARYRAFSEARYPLISFLDDDNWVGTDWISKVVRFFNNHPEATAVGGPSRAVFESDPPVWFSGISKFHAVGEQHAFSGDITNQPGTLLWTAGMSMRRENVLYLIKHGFHFLNCRGDNLSIGSGEDTELCYALRAAGGRLFYDQDMGIEHFMPTDRLAWPRALNLMTRIGSSSPVIDLYLFTLNGPSFETYPSWKKTWLFQMLKTLRQWLVAVSVHPYASFFLPENSFPALKVAGISARLRTLWNLRMQYRAIKNTISRLKSHCPQRQGF